MVLDNKAIKCIVAFLVIKTGEFVFRKREAEASVDCGYDCVTVEAGLTGASTQICKPIWGHSHANRPCKGERTRNKIKAHRLETERYLSYL